MLTLSILCCLWRGSPEICYNDTPFLPPMADHGGQNSNGPLVECPELHVHSERLRSDWVILSNSQKPLRPSNPAPPTPAMIIKLIFVKESLLLLLDWNDIAKE